MHVLPIRERSRQGESNRVCSYKAQGHVNNDSVKNKFWTAYFASISGFEVGLDRCEELEHLHVVVVSIHVELFRCEQVIGGLRVKRIPCGRIPWFELFVFNDVYVFLKGNWPAPIIPVSIIPTFDRRVEVLQGPQASNKISTIFELEKVDVPLVSRRQACNPSDFLIEAVVGDLSSGNLIAEPS